MENQKLKPTRVKRRISASTGKEEIYRKLIDCSLDVICSIDKEGKFVFVNAACKTMWGYEPHELIGRNCLDLIVEEDKETTLFYAQRHMRGEPVSNFQNQYVRKDGSIVPVLWSGWWDAEEQLMYCVAKDITERSEAERKARLQDEQLKRAYKLSKIGWWEWDVCTNTHYASDEVYDIYGLKRSEVPEITMDIYTSLVHPDDRPYMLKSVSELNTKKYIEIEHRMIKPSGEVIYLFHCTNVEKNDKGELIRVHGTTKDITEKVELQKMIIEEKINAQKEMAKAIIHTQEKERSEIGKELHDNVNQVLTTVKLYIENIRNYPEMSEMFIEKSIALAQRAINEIRFLAKQLVTPVMKDLGFEATILELVDHYQSLNKFVIDLDLDIKEYQIEDSMRLTIYRIIQEQLNNIVKYANASKVSISVVYDKGSIKLKISDDGVGFDPAKVVHGMGLNNIRNRAEVYKGKVSLKSSLGKGCYLSILFPVIECKGAAVA